MRKFLHKFQAKSFVSGFLIATMLSATLVWANTGGVWREVFYGVNVVVDGVPQNFPADMMPFITEGRTFLPVRGIADVFDVPVEWYGPTRTVYIGTIPHGMPFWTTVPFFERSSGTFATSAVNIHGIAYANAISNTGNGGNSWSHHALNGQFNSLTGSIGRVDGTSGNELATMSFIGDGRVLGSFAFDNNTMPQDVDIDVRGVLILRIEISEGINFSMLAHQRSPRIAFVDAMIQ